MHKWSLTTLKRQGEYDLNKIKSTVRIFIYIFEGDLFPTLWPHPIHGDHDLNKLDYARLSYNDPKWISYFLTLGS